MKGHKVIGSLIVEAESDFIGEATFIDNIVMGAPETVGDFHEVVVNGVADNRGIDFLLKGTGVMRVPVDYELYVSDPRALINKAYVDTHIGGSPSNLVPPGYDALIFWDNSETQLTYLALGPSLAISPTSVLDVVDDTTVQRVKVRRNSTVMLEYPTRPRLNFIEGAGIAISVTDDPTDNEIDINIATAGVGAGSVTSFSANDLTPLFTTNVDNPNQDVELSFALIPQANHVVFIGPTTGGPLEPTWRMLENSDLADQVITNRNISDRAALSVMGRSANTPGAPADIVASSDTYVLRRSGTSLGFGLIGPQSIQINTNKLIGRTSPDVGPAQEITIGANLTLADGVLSGEAGGGGGGWPLEGEGILTGDVEINGDFSIYLGTSGGSIPEFIIQAASIIEFQSADQLNLLAGTLRLNAAEVLVDNLTEDATKDQVIVKDPTTNKLYYRLAESLGGGGWPLEGDESLTDNVQMTVPSDKRLDFLTTNPSNGATGKVSIFNGSLYYEGIHPTGEFNANTSLTWGGLSVSAQKDDYSWSAFFDVNYAQGLTVDTQVDPALIASHGIRMTTNGQYEITARRLFFIATNPTTSAYGIYFESLGAWDVQSETVDFIQNGSWNVSSHSALINTHTGPIDLMATTDINLYPTDALNIHNLTQDATKTQVLVKDASTHRVYYRTAASIAALPKTKVTQNITGAVTIDLSTGDIFELTLTGNVTSFSFSNEVLNKEYIFVFKKDTSEKTLTWASGKYRFPFGSAPVLTNPTTNGTAGPARSVDIITALCNTAGRLDIVYTPDLIEN